MIHGNLIRWLSLLAILIIMGAFIMVIRHNKDITYTKTYKNAAGIEFANVGNRTKRAGVDGTNSRYIAPNGNDTTGTGTSGNPWLTLDKAIANLDTTYKNILIIRNSYVGEMVFDAPSLIIPDDCCIQTDDVTEYAVIEGGDINYTDCIMTPVSGRHFEDMDYNPSTGRAIAATSVNSGATEKLWYSDDEGVTWNVLTTSPAVSQGWAGISYGNGIWVATHVVITAKPYWSNDDGATWNIATGTTGVSFSTIGFGNGYFICQEASGLLRSTDGNTWSLVDSNLKNASALEYGNGRWLNYNSQSPPGLYYSDDDGLTWNLMSTNLNFPSDAFIGYKYYEGLWVAGGSTDPLLSFSGMIWYSDDNGNTWNIASSLPPVPSGITSWYFFIVACIDGLWMVGNSYRPVYSIDGKNWVECGNVQPTSSAQWSYIWATGSNFVASLNLYGYKAQYSSVSMIYAAKKIYLNGLRLKGNDHPYGVITQDQTNNSLIDLRFCNIDNIKFDAIGQNSKVIIENSIFHDIGRDAIHNTIASSTTEDSIFYNIEGTAIIMDTFSHLATVEHCTFYNCGTALHLKVASLSNDWTRNHLFAKCGYALRSDVDRIEIRHSVIEGSLINAYPAATGTIVGAEVLFHDALNGNLEIRHIEEGYVFDSPGVEAADDTHVCTYGTPARDCGAWILCFDASTPTWKSTIINGDDLKVNRPIVLVNAQSSITFSGAYNRSYRNDLVNYNVDIKQGKTSLTNEIREVLTSNLPLQVFPVDYGGVLLTGGLSTFTWLDKTDILGKVKMEINDANETLIKTLMVKERIEGMFIAVNSIAGAASPWNVAYPFKILEYDNYHTLILENYYDHYPGSGFSADPDGNYGSGFLLFLFFGRFQWKSVTEGIHELAMTNLNQLFQVNQWKGYWMTCNNNAMGSRAYVKIVENDEDTLWVKDYDNVLGGAGVDDWFYAGIDLIMMKSEPNELASSPFQEEGQIGKHGNDFYATVGATEQSSYLFQESNFGFKLIESAGEKEYIDYDTDGL